MFCYLYLLQECNQIDWEICDVVFDMNIFLTEHVCKRNAIFLVTHYI